MWIAFLVVIAASFVAGSLYGRSAEARAIGEAIRIESYADRELVAVRSKVVALKSKALDRLKKFL